MHAKHHHILCTIAGSDPTGGAGLQADLQTFTAHRATGAAVVTALTVQGAGGVARVEPVPPDLVAAQLAVVVDEVRPAALKTGMLWSGAIADVVVEGLDGVGAPLVVDPVLAASAGGALAAPSLRAALRRLFPRAAAITPNLPEAAWLLDTAPIAPGGVADAARALLDLGPEAVVVTGGHGPDEDTVEDVLATRGGRVERLRVPRRAGGSPHGTGCAFAAALAARLAGGADVVAAARGAQAYVARVIEAAVARGGPLRLVHDPALSPRIAEE